MLHPQRCNESAVDAVIAPMSLHFLFLYSEKDGLSFNFDILFSHKYQVLGALFNVAPMYFSFNVYLDM